MSSALGLVRIRLLGVKNQFFLSFLAIGNVKKWLSTIENRFWNNSRLIPTFFGETQPFSARCQYLTAEGDTYRIYTSIGNASGRLRCWQELRELMASQLWERVFQCSDYCFLMEHQKIRSRNSPSHVVNHRNRIFWFRPNTNLRWLEITEYSAETEYSVTVYL